jgi:hypothetical protein
MKEKRPTTSSNSKDKAMRRNKITLYILSLIVIFSMIASALFAR